MIEIENPATQRKNLWECYETLRNEIKKHYRVVPKGLADYLHNFKEFLDEFDNYYFNSKSEKIDKEVERMLVGCLDRADVIRAKLKKGI